MTTRGGGWREWKYRARADIAFLLILTAPLSAAAQCGNCPPDSIPPDTIRQWLETRAPIQQIGWAMNTFARFNIRAFLDPPDSAEYLVACDAVLFRDPIELVEGAFDTVRVYLHPETRSLDWGYFPADSTNPLPLRIDVEIHTISVEPNPTTRGGLARVPVCDTLRVDLSPIVDGPRTTFHPGFEIREDHARIRIVTQGRDGWVTIRRIPDGW
jgi:hypothetical protein